MSSNVSFEKEYPTRTKQASAWRIRIDADARVEDSSEFQDWFADPQNQDAYAQICATWDAFDDHLAAPQLVEIRRDALTDARRASRQRVIPTRRWIGALAAVVIVAIGVGLGTWQYLQLPDEYVTSVGERRTVVLGDGSRISLDSDTAVRVRYTDDKRQLVLERGRARFDVAHNVNRPFMVTAGSETVIAVGTSFNVERLGQKVLVTLIEGRVVVKTADGETAPEVVETAALRPKPVALTAGQQLVAVADLKPIVAPANLPVATAWEGGHLIFNDAPLSEAVEQVNRYTEKPLQVDPAIAQLRISGVFNAGDVSAFVDAITSFFPVQTTVNDSDQTVLEKRS